MSFSERLREARKRKGWTQKKLATESKLATGTIQQYELNKRIPKPEALAKIAKALDLGCSYTKEGEPYFYDFIDTVPDPRYAENEKFNQLQHEDAMKEANGYIPNKEITLKPLKDEHTKMNLQLFAIDENQKEVLNKNFELLNDIGKSKAVEYVADLVGNPKYRKVLEENTENSNENEPKQ